MQAQASAAKPHYYELPLCDDVIQRVCDRRWYDPTLFALLMAERAMTVSVKPAGSSWEAKIGFQHGGHITHQCRLDCHPQITIKKGRAEEWVWKGVKRDGVCLVIDHPIDLLEITSNAEAFLEQISLVIAGATPAQIASMMASGQVKNRVLLAAPSYAGGRNNLGLMAHIHRISLHLATPAPYAGWEKLRDAVVVKREEAAQAALHKLRLTMQDIIVSEYYDEMINDENGA